MKNSWDIAIFLCWTERPFHYDIKLIFSQKCHMRRKKLIFFYFVKPNIISSMAICPDKSKTNILYYVWYLNKHNFVSFFWAKKKILNKKHLSQKLGDRRICTFWDICQFFLKPMALRYMEKLTFVWKCTYSVIPKFLWQISSCKVGVQNDPPKPPKIF